MESQVGTPAWMAPEVLRGEEYSLSADMYSFGVVIWELTQRREPHKHLNQFVRRRCHVMHSMLRPLPCYARHAFPVLPLSRLPCLT